MNSGSNKINTQTRQSDTAHQMSKCCNWTCVFVTAPTGTVFLSPPLSHSPSPSLSCRLSLCRVNAAGGPHEQQLSLGFSPPFGYWPAAWWLALFQGTARRSWVQILPQAFLCREFMFSSCLLKPNPVTSWCIRNHPGKSPKVITRFLCFLYVLLKSSNLNIFFPSSFLFVSGSFVLLPRKTLLNLW